jgi:hypothetical protein
LLLGLAVSATLLLLARALLVILLIRILALVSLRHFRLLIELPRVEIPFAIEIKVNER